MNSVYIYHHLGLGDHIIANGLVRTVAKNYDRVYLFCKQHNVRNVSFMYRDLNKLKIIILDDIGVKQFMNVNSSNNYLIIGHDDFYKIKISKPHLTIDEIFYHQANVPLKNKWGDFFVERDLEKEKEIFKKLNLLEDDKYCFVHGDLKISTNLKIIKPRLEFSLFDYLYTIENAAEIHCVNSSFYCLIDCIGIKNKKMYLHIPGNYDVASIGVLGSDWKICKK